MTDPTPSPLPFTGRRLVLAFVCFEVSGAPGFHGFHPLYFDTSSIEFKVRGHWRYLKHIWVIGGKVEKSRRRVLGSYPVDPRVWIGNGNGETFKVSGLEIRHHLKPLVEITETPGFPDYDFGGVVAYA